MRNFGRLVAELGLKVPTHTGAQNMLNYKDLGGDKQTRNAKMTARVREALLDVIQNPPKKAFKIQRD